MCTTNPTGQWHRLLVAAVHGSRPASGVIGEAKELHSAGLPVVVVLALLVITSIGQQGALGVPRHSEGGRVTLHLPQLLPCRHTAPPLDQQGFIKNKGREL